MAKTAAKSNYFFLKNAYKKFHGYWLFPFFSPIQIETVESMHYSLPTSGGDDDDDQAGNSNVLAQMLLGAAQPNLLENLSRFNLLKGISINCKIPILNLSRKIASTKEFYTFE